MNTTMPTADELRPVWEAFARAAGHADVLTVRTRFGHGHKGARVRLVEAGPDLVTGLCAAAAEIAAEKRADLDAANVPPGCRLVYAENWPAEVRFHPDERVKISERGAPLALSDEELEALRTREAEAEAEQQAYLKAARARREAVTS